MSLRVAAVVTVYYPKSHADVIVTKFMKGWSTDQGFFEPEVRLVSMYLDHLLESDIGMDLADEYGVPIYPSIRSALHAGSDKLDVDAVLLIGEHGDYPWNERQRHMYPRRYFFEQIAGVFAESGRSVPLFSDKHFAYDFRDAQWMWNRAADLNIPLMAGSSLPLSWRDPWLEHEKESGIEEAITIGHGGIESYGYHALEALQCMVERRRCGETGVVSVQCLEGNDVWRARDKGLWSQELAEAACSTIVERADGPMEQQAKEPAVFLIERSDGLKSATLMLNGYVNEFAYAARVDGGIHSTFFRLQNSGTFAHFGYLCHNIQHFFLSGIPPYRPERTLLATGIIDAVMNSRYEDHRVVETPDLNIAYESYDTAPFRPSAPRPAGACIDPDSPDVL